MELVTESPFLDKEKQFTDTYKYEGDKNQEVQDDDDYVAHQQATFIQEKGELLNHVYDLVLHAAKLHEIELDKIFHKGEPRRAIAEAVESVIKNDQDALNLNYRVGKLLVKYIEQSTILDPILADMIEPTMRVIQIYSKKACKDANHKVPPEMANLFEMLYNLCNVRGYKTVVRFLPHEAADMEPCVELLWFQNQGMETNTQHFIPAMLTLWLSIIVLVPFDIKTIDSKSSTYEELVKRIIKLGIENIENPGKLRDYSAILLSKLLTRPDVLKQGETDACLK